MTNLERWCNRHGRFEHVELPAGRDPANLPACLAESEADPAATFAAAVAAGAMTAAERAADEALAKNDRDEEDR